MLKKLSSVYNPIGAALKLDGLIDRELLVLRGIDAVTLVLVVDEAIAHQAGGRHLCCLALQAGRNLEGGGCAWRNDYANVEGLSRQVPLHLYITIGGGLQGTDKADAVSHLRPNEEMAVSHFVLVGNYAG